MLFTGLACAWILQVGDAEELPLLGEGAGALVGWKFSPGPEFPGAAGEMATAEDGSLRLQYDFAGGGAYVEARRAIDPPVALRGFRMRARIPAEAMLVVRVRDATGQEFQKSANWGHADWQEIEVRLGGWAVNWGGAADGVVHQPITGLSVIADRVGLVDVTGEYLVRDIVGLPGSADATHPAHTGAYTVTDFASGAEFARTGPCSLDAGRWEADFTNADLVALHHSISLLGQPSELELTLDDAPAGLTLKLELGSHFQTFGRTLGTTAGGPQTFRFPLPPGEGWTYWGGENDGVARPPLRVTTLVAERGEAPAEPSVIDLGELRCVTTAPSDEAVTLMARVTDTGEAGDTRTLRVECDAWNLLPDGLEGQAHMTLRDWQGDAVTETSVPWTVAGGGSRQTIGAAFEAPAALRYVEAEVRFEAEGQRTASVTASFVAPAEEPGDPSLKPDSPWGMGTYLYRFPANDYGYDLMERQAALAQAAGVKWTREEFQWRRIEPRQGEFDFSFYDRMVDIAGSHGISVYGLLAYWSGWTEPYTETGIDDFCAWARVVVRRYKDRIKHWEVYNEPNIFFWSGPRELYPVLLERCYAAIKEEDPEARVLGCSTAGIDHGFIRMCVDAGAPFDILTIHPYRPWLDEASFMEELRGASEVAGGRSVWITEMGWPTYIGATTEREQAELIARTYLSAVASGACGNICWYNFRNDGNDPHYNEHNFGVLRNDLSPKPAYRALRTVCTTFGSGKPRPAQRLSDRVHGVLGDGSLALWTRKGPADVVVRVMTEAKLTNLMGDVLETWDAGDHTVRLTGPSPVFVRGGAADVVSCELVEGDEPEAGLLVF